jgi:hypothetical protein
MTDSQKLKLALEMLAKIAGGDNNGIVMIHNKPYTSNYLAGSALQQIVNAK